MNKKYLLSCIFNEDIQKNWKPNVGDIIIGSTGNVFVISGYHDLVESLGGKLYFFGGSLCNRDGGSLLHSTRCFTMNEKGYNPNLDVYSISSFSEFRYVPYPHELV